MTEIIYYAGICAGAAAIVLGFLGRATLHQVNEGLAVAFTLMGVSDMMRGSVASTCVDAAAATWHWYQWWYRGGAYSVRSALQRMMRRLK